MMNKLIQSILLLSPVKLAHKLVISDQQENEVESNQTGKWENEFVTNWSMSTVIYADVKVKL